MTTSMFFVLVPFLKRAPSIFRHPSCEECRDGRRSIDVNHTSQLEEHSSIWPVQVQVPVPDSGFPGFPYARRIFRRECRFLSRVEGRGYDIKCRGSREVKTLKKLISYLKL